MNIRCLGPFLVCCPQSTLTWACDCDIWLSSSLAVHPSVRARGGCGPNKRSPDPRVNGVVFHGEGVQDTHSITVAGLPPDGAHACLAGRTRLFACPSATAQAHDPEPAHPASICPHRRGSSLSSYGTTFARQDDGGIRSLAERPCGAVEFLGSFACLTQVSTHRLHMLIWTETTHVTGSEIA